MPPSMASPIMPPMKRMANVARMSATPFSPLLLCSDFGFNIS